MTWNLLNYPDYNNVSSDTALRNPYYRTVVGYVNPDILVTEENAATNSVSMFLNNVVNPVGAGAYSGGAYINGYDTDNGIFYRTADFQFISNTAIHTDLRDINEFKLMHIQTGDTIRIYACHLKASYGPPNDAQRALEVDSLRKVTNMLPAGTDFIICGDFNIYGSYESAYNKLLQNNTTDDGNFIDTYTMTGTWNQPSYANYHTQSTRLASFGGGASGGLNDRFDMILYSTSVSQPGKVAYVAGSMTPVGNDAIHYNLSINSPPNIIVPSNVATALYYVSDHLPVSAVFEFASPTEVNEYSKDNSAIKIFPDPATENIFIQFYVPDLSEITIRIYTITGTMVKEFPFGKKEKGYFTYEIYNLDKMYPGIYFVAFQIDATITYKKIVIASHF
ncbi:MAG: T9SS type A sorting domain-containing protein [Bacteroidota bacterium]